MENRIFYLNSILDFGKYKGEGKTVKNVMWDDPYYIEWCIKNISWFALNNEAMNHFWNDVTIEWQTFTGERPGRKTISHWRNDSQAKEVYDLNQSKLSNFSDQNKHSHRFYYEDNSRTDYEADTWDAMTDGMYGDMPDGFDGDYDFLG